MNSKDSWHRHLLATTAVGISLMAAYSLVNSEVGRRSLAEFSFPQNIPLTNWQQANNEILALESQKEVREQVQVGNLYRYINGEVELDITMYYLANTRGDVDDLLSKHTSTDFEDWQLREIAETDRGFYRLVSNREGTHIAGCLNSIGTTTVSEQQFSSSLNGRQLDLDLFRDWLLGRASIRDRRCLWVMISTSNSGLDSLEPIEVLLPVWHSWLDWWQSNFPSL